MAVLPTPIQRYLTPEVKPTTPAGFTQIGKTLLNGLPHTIQLTENITLVIVVPNGLAVTWRDADPTTLISVSDDELEPHVADSDEPIGNVARAPVRMLMRVAGTTVGSIPLVAGLRRTVPDSGETDRGVQIELVILSWDRRAGSLRGRGDFGSRISLAWRRADEAVEQYSTPIVNPHLVPRLPPEDRMESRLGLKAPVQLQRFQIKKVINYAITN